MPKTPPAPPLDLEGKTFRVLLLEHAGRGQYGWEGETTFTLTAMPYLTRLGHRWLIRVDALPGFEAVAGREARTWSPDYREGASSISLSEQYTLLLLDRDDPREREASTRAALEMALDVFCVQEGLEGVSFE